MEGENVETTQTAPAEPEAEVTQPLAQQADAVEEGAATEAPSDGAPEEPQAVSASEGKKEPEEPGLIEKVEEVVEEVEAAVEAGFIALRHIIRNGREYHPGDPITFERAISRWLHTENGAEPEWSETPEQVAASIEQLKASGAIKEA